jgi:hypothetical protein
VYGPVRTVVWQGSAGDRRPYADLVAHSERARSAGPSTARRPPTRDLSRRAFDKSNVYGMAANAETDRLALEIG